MESLLNTRSVRMSQRIMDRQEECPISGDYVLPEYCPDIAVILKCFAYPHIQSRQWSGEQLLLDGVVDVRMLYLDEDRQCVRCFEFAQPFSCSVRGNAKTDATAVELRLLTKYLNCRAVSPRRVEVRGAITVCAQAECGVDVDIAEPMEIQGFFCRADKMPVTIPGNISEKVMSISESLEFDQSLPPAEMLLGGECQAIIKECKLLAGKAIIKGLVYIHQLYTDTVDGKYTHALLFAVPFSQIMDVADAQEGLLCRAAVQILSDTERCSVGPDGENTMLDVTIKLLLQVQIYCPSEVTILQDAFHCRYPIHAKNENVAIEALVGQRFEETRLSVSSQLPAGQWQEVVDVWAQPQETKTECIDGKAVCQGRMQIGVIVRDNDGELSCHEFYEDYRLEYPVEGNAATIVPTVIGVNYRINDNKVEMQILLHICITVTRCAQLSAIKELSLLEESPYPTTKANTLLYYANRGETIWDIGRQCHASPTAIAHENNLSGETVAESCVLIVPIVS